MTTPNDSDDLTPNRLVVDAFKPVIDAAMEFALVDDALHDGLHYLGGPNPDERAQKALARAEAELLADYAEARIAHEPGEPEHMRALGALSEILASLSRLIGIRDVLLERCEGES